MFVSCYFFLWSTGSTGTALTPSAVVMPWTRAKQDSILIAFSAYIAVAGDITFMVSLDTLTYEHLQC